MMPIIFVRPVGPRTMLVGITGFGRCRQNPKAAIAPRISGPRAFLRAKGFLDHAMLGG
ncbi:MAG: hypothetical protein ING72_04970 [Methylobacterium sp.]|jgi:hypothetical protein|nr:hypothetical protein [Methylobacterium sp.]MCA3597937.1 hypothetical protein [Methylobacterium sp.]MCA3600016.1 hypothetical protein [Methylobacterium sp.]MCA3604551.1 hypothetical protein [Methylobacterium sp.]MCA3607554.1 hypothetical protein [Methylobacterium sp.]